MITATAATIIITVFLPDFPEEAVAVDVEDADEDAAEADVVVAVAVDAAVELANCA